MPQSILKLNLTSLNFLTYYTARRVINGCYGNQPDHFSSPPANRCFRVRFLDQTVCPCKCSELHSLWSKRVSSYNMVPGSARNKVM